MAFTQAIALCRSQAQAGTEITFADYCTAYGILNRALTATTYALNENELVLQGAVSKLHAKLGRAVTATEIRNVLGWHESMTYKYVRASVSHNLIRYESGTREKNVKPVLPIPGASDTFLPSPRKILEHAKGLGRAVKFVDPFTGKLRTVSWDRQGAA